MEVALVKMMHPETDPDEEQFSLPQNCRIDVYPVKQLLKLYYVTFFLCNLGIKMLILDSVFVSRDAGGTGGLFSYHPSGSNVFILSTLCEIEATSFSTKVAVIDE